MTERPDDLTQPISSDATREQPPLDAAQPAADAAQPVLGAGQPATDPAQPAADAPAWTSAATAGDGTASAHPVPIAGVAPAASYAAAVPPAGGAAAATTKPWRSRVSSGRGLAVAALVVGLGVGAVGGSAVTFAATHHDDTGTVADRTGGFDHDGDGDFGPPDGGRDGFPPGDGRRPGGGQQQGGGGGTLPGGDGSTGGSSGSGTAANGASQGT